MMASALYRLGRWAFEHRGRMLLIWVAVLPLVAVCAVTFHGSTSNTFSLPGTEGQRAIDLLNAKFPGTGGTPATIVFAVPAGQTLTDATHQAAIRRTLAEARSAPQVAAVADPFTAGSVSADKRIAYASVVYPIPVGQIADASKTDLANSAQPARTAGVQVEFGGGVVAAVAAGDSSVGISIVIAYILLVIMFGSLLAAGIPLLMAVIGVGIGLLGLTALSGVVNESSTAPILAIMLGLAVGIDYSLFIVSRHRQQLGDGLAPPESIRRAIATSGSAVIFAGLTVVIALAGLSIVRIPFLTVMGLAAAGTVAVAVLIAVTLLPAVLGFGGARLGRGVFSRKGGASPQPRIALGWARFVTGRPLPVLLVSVVGLVLLALPVFHMRLGLPGANTQPTTSTERRAYDLLSAGFGPGFNGPLLIVVDAPGKNPKLIAQGVVKGLHALPDVAQVGPPMQNRAGDVTLVTVYPRSGPSTQQTKDLVNLVRAKAAPARLQTGVNVMVTGTTAINIDVSNTLSAALPVFAVVVVVLALLLLSLVFRSILVPLKSVLGFLLSIFASLGVVVSIFQDGHLANLFGVTNTGPILSFLPVLLVGILFGLAMDYEVFLVSRMRESYLHTGDARNAVVAGFAQSGRVVTTAALIMFTVFGSFALSSDATIKAVGISLAFGVLVDAFVVRMTIVPAVMALLGRRAWWLPRWLDRAMPNLDIEGEQLMQQLEELASGEADESAVKIA
jgi:membrane protein YdfJ